MDACFEKAVSFLSPGIRSVLLQLDEPVQRETYEVRLRAEQPVVLFGKVGSATAHCRRTGSTQRCTAPRSSFPTRFTACATIRSTPISAP